jgi:uncharacterized protein YyaL (SSP411 family)
MLYDNAQLARVYLHAWQITHIDFYRRVAEETLDYVVRDMTLRPRSGQADPQAGFYSSQDADSEGVEGKFFVWTPEEIRAALGDDARLFIDAYGVTDHGNFVGDPDHGKGENILYVARDNDVLAAMHNLSLEEVGSRLAAARRKLFEVREARVKPARDEKVLTGWNGLMLAAFAEPARVLKREDYRAIAERNADFILRELKGAGGRLRRSWKAGDVRHMGYLEDYANLIEGVLVLYETTSNARWFVAARDLADTVLEHFSDPAGGFFDTSDDAEVLVTRPKDLQDHAVPSGNAMAATVLLKLGAFTGEGRYGDAAERALRMLQPVLGSAPTGFAQWLSALDFALGEAKEIAIVGPTTAAQPRPVGRGTGDGAQELLDVVFGEYRRNQVVASARDNVTAGIPLLEGRTPLNGHATAYVCRNFVCELPVTDPEALAAQLNR